jgi:molybdopterin/thiamine biosynthesis adenylyltransferase
MASWWERDPAALDAEIKELTDAGFRVRRETAANATLQLIVEREGESYQLTYWHETTRRGYRLVVRKPWPDPELAIPSEGSALEGIERLRRWGIQLFDRGPRSIFVPDALLSRVAGAGGLLRLGRSRTVCGTYALWAITGSRPELDALDNTFNRSFPDAVSGLWARGEIPNLLTSSVEAAVAGVEAAIASAHGLSEEDLRKRHRCEVLGLVRSSGGEAARAEWTFVRRDESGKPFVLSTQSWSEQDLAQRAPFARSLAGKKVSLIGCGAVGWTVALELARSGVSNFVLYDDDRVHPFNLPRLHAFMGAAGRFKVDALAEQLESIAPGVSVQARTSEVGLHVGTAALVSDAPDLYINLTGEEVSTDETNAASLITGRPALYGWVSNGVYAGRVFRVLPGVTACYDCVREAPPAPIRTSGPIPTDPEHAWEGASFDVDLFACVVARTAVLTLLGKPVPDHFVLDFEGVVPTARLLGFERRPSCRWCA